MTEIYTNLLATEKMLKYLETNKHFEVENIDDLDAIVPIFRWWLLARDRDKSGNVQIIKGPYYQCDSIKIRDAIQLPKGHLFRIAGRIIYATFSKDLDFDVTKEYKIDTNNGEIYVYPAIIDGVGL